MAKKTIWVNTIVCNEENFIWFALMSVIDYVDKILVWDTGSNDKTVQIIKEVVQNKGKKIEFKEVGPVNRNGFTEKRQAMLEESKCDWVLVLDGDEVWWEDSIKKLKEQIEIEGDKLDAIAAPFYNCVGDIYHHQSEEAGEYRLLGRKGHLTLKAINRKIPGLHWSMPYGQEGLYNEESTPIQNNKSNRLFFLEAFFLHLSHLKRSSISRNKFKYDLGVSFPSDFKYPEVFYEEKPEGVPSPWLRRSKKYEAISLVKKPLQSLWRVTKYKMFRI